MMLATERDKSLNLRGKFVTDRRESWKVSDSVADEAGGGPNKAL